MDERIKVIYYYKLYAVGFRSREKILNIHSARYMEIITQAYRKIPPYDLTIITTETIAGKVLEGMIG